LASNDVNKTVIFAGPRPFKSGLKVLRIRDQDKDQRTTDMTAFIRICEIKMQTI